MLARTHEATTFALTCTAAALAGVPPVGCVLLALVGAGFGDWPDIDMPRARVTQALCLLRYPVRVLDERGRQKIHEKGRREGRLKWAWRSFPGHQIHLVLVGLSALVFDACATDDDRRDTVPRMGAKFRTHRGLTHSVWFALGTGAGLWAVLPTIGGWLVGVFSVLARVNLGPIFGTTDLRTLLSVTAVVGVLGHILGDGCTDYGVAPFAPLLRWNGRRYVEMGLWTPLRFKVSEWVETAIVTPLSLVAGAVSIAGAFGVLDGLWGVAGRFWGAL